MRTRLNGNKITCHWLEPITVILSFLKIFNFRETIAHFRTIIFLQSPGFQFSVFPSMPFISSCKNSSCVPEVVAYEGNLIITEEKWFIQEFGPQIRPSSTEPNSKSFQDFHPWIPLRGLRVFGCWLACWICVSPASDF